jgi:IS5 family transposase
VVDRKGIPLAVMLSGANVHDSMLFEDLIDGIEPIKRPRGRPRKRPEKLHADKAYDDKKCARALSKRGIKRRIARKGVESSEKLGRHRWGSWSGRWLGSPNTATSRSVTSAETIYMRRSCLSAVL